MEADSKKNTDQYEFEDVENYRGGSQGVSVKDQVMKQLFKCMEEGSKEMDGGGVRTRIIDGQAVNIAVGNQREIFMNSVDMLWILVSPDYEKHKKMFEERVKKFGQLMKKINQKFANSKKSCHAFYKKKKSPEGDYPFIKEEMESIKSMRESYERDRVELYRYKLKTISKLLNKINYYAEGSFTA